jgi:hypothetical protein
VSHPNPAPKPHHHAAGGLESVGLLLADAHPDLLISSRRIRLVESLVCVRLRRKAARQNQMAPESRRIRKLTGYQWSASP